MKSSVGALIRAEELLPLLFSEATRENTGHKVVYERVGSNLGPALSKFGDARAHLIWDALGVGGTKASVFSRLRWRKNVADEGRGRRTLSVNAFLPEQRSPVFTRDTSRRDSTNQPGEKREWETWQLRESSVLPALQGQGLDPSAGVQFGQAGPFADLCIRVVRHKRFLNVSARSRLFGSVGVLILAAPKGSRRSPQNSQSREPSKAAAPSLH